jgi:RimJ/RimL family protein N-acetyltransferase
LQALVPVLETTRLRLRAPRMEDFGIYAAILMSERSRHIGTFDHETAWLDFVQYVSGWVLRGMGCWTVEAKADRTVLGFINVAMEFGDHEPELGFIFTEKAEGQGFAFEAAEAARRHAQDNLNLPTLVSYIDPPNTRSIALAERLGAQPDAIAAKAFDEPVLVYRHLPDTAPDMGTEART